MGTACCSPHRPCHSPLLVMDVHLSRKSSLIQPWVRRFSQEASQGWLAGHILVSTLTVLDMRPPCDPSMCAHFKVEPLGHFSLYQLSQHTCEHSGMMTINCPLQASYLDLIPCSSVCVCSFRLFNFEDQPVYLYAYYKSITFFNCNTEGSRYERYPDSSSNCL